MELEADGEKDTCELNKEFFHIHSFSSAAFWLAVTKADNKNSRYGFICNVWSLLTELFDVDLTLLTPRRRRFKAFSSSVPSFQQSNDTDTEHQILWELFHRK